MLFLLIQNYRYQPSWYDQIWYELNSGGQIWLYILVAIIFFYLFFKKTQKTFHSHWNAFLPTFKYSSVEFYEKLVEELKSQEIPKLDTSLALLREGGVATSRRKYLRIEWKYYQYYVCCAPFGNGTFVSWWLSYKVGVGQIIVNRIPFIGGWLARKWYPVTYYTIDSASMFMTCCHEAVLKVTDEITKNTAIRVSDDKRKPILKDIFKR